MKRRAAFTIVECICALLITSLVVLGIGALMTSVRQANRSDLNEAVDWYMFLQELESPRHRFELRHVYRSSLILYGQVAARSYELKGSTCFYLTGGHDGGYLPLIDNLKAYDCDFKQLDEQRVLIEVERKNGQHLAGIVKFYPPQTD
ncbi:hypothetical protein [Limosilactobacillus caccae]|jgi:competence protein ComGF|uniref:hypothetical protein n=1 Tax=Limosilactobacillus caccae TaxID=1926284 RepID=UPI0009714566|nr:hypothetical protein [Limosilactobacillus caccae]